MPFSTESRSPQLILNQILAGDTRFTGWTDYSEAKPFSVTQPKSVRACLGGSEGSMLSKWHGEFEWDNFTVKFHTHRGQKTGVVIEYGKNLTALEQDEDNSGVYTQLLAPWWQTSSRPALFSRRTARPIGIWKRVKSYSGLMLPAKRSPRSATVPVFEHIAARGGDDDLNGVGVVDEGGDIKEFGVVSVGSGIGILSHALDYRIAVYRRRIHN